VMLGNVEGAEKKGDWGFSEMKLEGEGASQNLNE